MVWRPTDRWTADHAARGRDFAVRTRLVRGRGGMARTVRGPGENGDGVLCEERELRRVTQAEYGEPAVGSREGWKMATATWIDAGTERRVRVHGDLDHAGCEELTLSLGEAVGGDVRTVVLRMEDAGSICSRGVTMLLGAHHRLRREGRTLLVTGLRPQVRDVLDRLGVFQAVPEWDPNAAARS